MDINSAVGRKMGVTQEQLFELNEYKTSSAFDARERVALELTDELVKTPANVSDELYARLLQQFSYPELVELAATIAFENYRARFNRVFNIGSADFSHGAVCALPARKVSSESSL
jgi:alkylhydroperoxidase family enzyme